MKTIVILAGLVHNQSSPTGNISNRFYEILSKEYNVKLLYVANSPENTQNIPNNYIPVKDPLIDILYNCKGKKRLVISTMIRIFRKIQSFYNKQIYLGWYLKESFLLLDKIKEKLNIDLVISFSSPFITHIAAKRFCEENHIPWLAVTIDPLYHSKQKINEKELRFEKEVYESAHYNFFTKELINSKLNLYKNHKIVFDELPYEIPDNTTSKKSSHSNEISMIYQGSFYKKIREPHYMLEVLSKLPSNYKINIYSRGKYQKLIESYSKKFTNIFYKGFVSNSEIKKALYEADVFLNISNSISDFAPSKVFEYISYGKPIINFSSNSYNSQIFDSYSLCLSINESKLSNLDASKEIVKFIKNNMGKRISYNEIQKMYTENSYTNFIFKVLNTIKNFINYN